MAAAQGALSSPGLTGLTGPGGIQQLGVNFGGPDKGAMAQPTPVAPSVNGQPSTQVLQSQQANNQPDLAGQLGSSLGKSALSSGFNDLTGTDFGGPLTSLAMGADPGKVATNYAEQQGVGAGLSALGADSAVPYAGAITSALNGNVGSAAGNVAGELIGDMIMPGVGGFIGSALGGAIGGGCYITTAAHVANDKVDDDAYELKTLRHFRDTFMRDDPFLSHLADDYERLSPSIVEGINARKDSKDIYKHIHTKYLVPATRAVTRGKNIDALHIYAEMVAYVAPMAVATTSDPQAAATLGHEAKMVVKATA